MSNGNTSAGDVITVLESDASSQLVVVKPAQLKGVWECRNAHTGATFLLSHEIACRLKRMPNGEPRAPQKS